MHLDTVILWSTNSCSQTQHYSSKSTWPQCRNQQDGELPLYTASSSSHNVSHTYTKQDGQKKLFKIDIFINNLRILTFQQKLCEQRQETS